MKRYNRILPTVLVSVCFVLIQTATVFAQGNTDDDAAEKQALVDFYNATQGSAWISQWNISKLQDASTNLSDFTAGDLQNVMISNSDVVSIIIPDCNNTVGSIPASFHDLTHLITFQVRSNTSVACGGINANKISGLLPNLSTLSGLQVLNLNNNSCTGTVDWLNMPTLKSVDLSSDYSQSNHLIINSSSFNALTTLETLHLDYNSFTSNQLASSFSYLDNLTNLTLVHCNLSASSFPVEFGDMGVITNLDLSGNALISVPSVIGNLKTLKTLSLNSVSLLTLPDNIVDLDALTTLNLEGNNFTIANNNSVLHDMVELLKGCNVLTNLDLANNLLSDVPTNFASLVPLRYLSLDKNPIDDSAMPNLQGSLITNLSLRECHLTNSLPHILSSLSQLNWLDIGNGADFGNPSRDNSLDLSQTNVSGVLQTIPHLSTLRIEYFSIRGQGPLPENLFANGSMANITELYADHNFVTQPIPNSILHNSNLKTLSLSSNALGCDLSDGTCHYIPLAVSFNCGSGQLMNLAYLNLSNNHLTNLPSDGNIENTPVPDLSACGQLQTLDISENSLTNTLPAYFETSLPLLSYVDLSNNNFGGVPRFYTRANASLFTLYAKQNFLDFEDLDPFYQPSCTLKIQTLSYYDQKTQSRKGSPATFYMPENLNATLQFASPGDPHNYYQWERNDNSVVSAFAPPAPNSTYVVTVTPQTAGLYHTEIQNVCVKDLKFKGADVTLMIIPPLCESEIPSGGSSAGQFKLDKLTGSIVFERTDCPIRIPISCAFAAPTTIDNVVSAKAITHSDDWSYTFLGLTPSTNPFESGERGKWRQKASYVQNTALIQSNDKNYNGGTFKLKTFNWLYGDKSNYPGWLKVNEIKKYSQHGQPLEEVNALEIPSVAKFGYGESVPYLIAKNASYESVLFESFENVYNGGIKFEDGFVKDPSTTVQTDPLKSHSGKNSLQVTGTFSFTIRQFKVEGNPTDGQTMLIKVWVKGTIDNSFQAELDDADGGYINSNNFTWLASSGEWSLYECVMNGYDMPNSTLTLSASGSGTIYLDDLRVQSLGTEMTGYVYDANTLRLLAVFDDQNFGLFYQYNAEGKLVRKIVETERGIKTVQETQYNTPKVPKP